MRPSRAAELEAVAHTIRQRIVRLAAEKPVHLGPSLSVVDILVAVYGLAVLDEQHPNVDRIILSKGHAAPALYFVLHEYGLLDVPADAIGRVGDTRAGHPSDSIPGVEAPTGALGHGLAVGAGMALGARLADGRGRVFVVLGDGELNEGSVWEAAAFAAHSRLGNLVALVDRNGLQQSGRTAAVLDYEPLAEKWRSFGWETVEVDGHDIAALLDLLARIGDRSQPTAIIAKTVKGKGVAFMEDDVRWHQAQLADEVCERALASLGEKRL